jgi:hypothetical protein
MPSPQLNLRVPLEHHDVLRAVAARLKSDAAFRDQLAALIAGVAAPVAGVAGDSLTARVDSLEERVKALEAGAGQESAGEPREAGEALEPLEAAGKAPGGPQKRRPWTEEDFAALRDLGSRGGTQADACRELGRTSSDVNKYWKQLGLPEIPRKGRVLGKRRM